MIEQVDEISEQVLSLDSTNGIRIAVNGFCAAGKTTFETCIARAKLRNQEAMQNSDAVESQYRKRYLPGFQMYLDRDRPLEFADVILANDNEAI